MKQENKHQRILSWRMALLPVLLIGLITFQSCDDDEAGPAPSVTVNPVNTSNIPGAKVSAAITVDAPNGGQFLSILRNGAADAAFPDVDIAGAKTFDYTLEYTLPANAVVGSTVVFTLQAIDKENLVSSVASFIVEVTDVPSKPIVTITAGSIITNTTWTASNVYRIQGFVRVGRDEHANVADAKANGPQVTGITLTIEPGTVVTGDPQSALIIQRGNKIMAQGTAAKPIIFTSSKPAGQREPGDWGGLVICGRASNNLNGTGGVGGNIGELEGQYGAFHGGGASPANDDNSGIVKYVRIEYAGYPINPNQEINALTMGSVGTGTTIDFVQCSYGLDDSFEWFGGTANAKHLIAYRGLDDDFDVDNGFSGNVQFGIGIRDDRADVSGSNGFEIDNDGSGTATSPYTSAAFSNISIIGPKSSREAFISERYQNAAHIRRNNKIKIINSFFTAFPNGIFLENSGAAPVTANAASGELVLKGNVLAGVENWGGNGFGSAGTIFAGAPANGANHAVAPRGFRVAASGAATFTNGIFTLAPVQIGTKEAEDWFDDNNTILAKWQDASISATLFENGTPTFTIASGTLSTGADFAGFTGFESVAFKGAFGTTDWTTGWTNFNPQNTNYSK